MTKVSDWAYSWNAPKKAIGAYVYESQSQGDVISGHPLVDDHVEKLRKKGEAEWSEPRGISLWGGRSRAKALRDLYQLENGKWSETPAGVEAKFEEQPLFIRMVWKQKIDWLKKHRAQKDINAFFMGTMKKALLRLEITRKSHDVITSLNTEMAAYYLSKWRHIPEFDKRHILSLANEISSRVTEMFYRNCEAINTTPETISDDDLKAVFRKVGTEIYSLRVVPPFWNELIRGEFDRLQCFSSLTRITCKEWWGRKLWRLRGDWRENQFRAVGVIHKRRMAYISKDALNQWTEQRKKNSQYFKSHELVDEDGNVASLEAMVLASVSNTTIRRHELMARQEGVEFVAGTRGDVGIFLTITCPSKYHSNTHAGHQNPKWNHSTPAQAQAYLNKVWQRATAKLKRKNLRPYGFRVAEPHHDGTPHWHALLFMPADHVDATVSILRSYFIKEDRAELGKDTNPRFKVKAIDPKLGSATAYIAKYISKNIDGYALDGELDDETGKPLNETAKLAMAWASQHRIRQFQPIGQPPVTVYRELRKLNNQIVSKQKINGTFKRGRPLISDPDMDSVLAAADAGCFATYILKQGGVLIPRELYTVRLAYEESEEVNTYGETPEKVYGVFSPRLGNESRICTRSVKWKIRSIHSANENDNANSVGVSAFSDGEAVPWSSVNNSTGEQKNSEKSESVGRTESGVLTDNVDIEKMTPKECRQLLRILKATPMEKRKLSHDQGKGRNLSQSDGVIKPITEYQVNSLRDFSESAGMHLTENQLIHLLRGNRLYINGFVVYATGSGELRRRKDSRNQVKVDDLWSRLKLNHDIDSCSIRHDPVNHYANMLKKADYAAWERLFSTE